MLAQRHLEQSSVCVIKVQSIYRCQSLLLKKIYKTVSLMIIFVLDLLLLLFFIIVNSALTFLYHFF